jgi:hypothetical protein
MGAAMRRYEGSDMKNGDAMRMNDMMKNFLPVLALAVAVVGSGVAKADTINFAQFGADGTNLGSPLVGTTEGGVGVTITSPNGSFEILQEGTDWNGIFPLTAPILFDGEGSGPVTLTFATGISSLTLAGQANFGGAYTETATAFSGATQVDTTSASSFNFIDDTNPADQGIVPFLTVTGADITKVTFSVTDDGAGLALYGGAGVTTTATPEPVTLPLLGLGLVGLAFVSRRMRTSTASRMV